MPKLRVAIIDYDAGNLYSVEHACNFVGLLAKITSDKADIWQADGVILPGVGAFGEAMGHLRKLDLITTIQEFIKTGKPFMGICLGMQLLFSESEEFGKHTGLDIIKGKVLKFPGKDKKGNLIRVPQIGWNTIYPRSISTWRKTYLQNLKKDEFMYFVHSYYCFPSDKNDILTLTSYEDFEYCSSILRKNVFATQFHPEKSGPEGIKIYKNFALKLKGK